MVENKEAIKEIKSMKYVLIQSNQTEKLLL